MLATQSQQLNKRLVRPQAALEEADFFLQRRAAQFIAEEAAVDGALEYSHSVFGHSGVYGENRRGQQCHREQPEERLEDVKTANRRDRNEREHRFPPDCDAGGDEVWSPRRTISSWSRAISPPAEPGAP